MAKISKILVPTDFSDSARIALDQAAELARVFGASLALLHVWELPGFLPGELVGAGGVAHASLLDLVRDRANDRLAALVAQAGTKGIHFASVSCIPGVPHATIVDTASEGHYDLIVLGSHGRTGLQRALLGSVAERVVRHAPCTVVVGRSPKATEPP